MITKTKSFTTSDGAVHATLEAAQLAELGHMFAEQGHPLLAKIVENRAAVVDVLSTGPRSRPAARAVNGATRKRTTKPPAVPHNRVGDAYTKMRAAADNTTAKDV